MKWNLMTDFQNLIICKIGISPESEAEYLPLDQRHHMETASRSG